MGQWGVSSYDNDAASDALDAAFERIHGSAYEDLMDDRNPLSVDQVHARLANPETLAEAVAKLRRDFGPDLDEWDDEARLALAGIVVRHAELGVAIPDELRRQALAWLEGEAIEWHEATLRRLRREAEIALLGRA